MSNSKRYSEGNKGSDLSYRGKVLKGLQKVSDNTAKIKGAVETVETAGALDITGTSGSTSPAYKSVTFVCAEGEVTIGGQVFPAGTYTFNNPNGTLAAITYSATTSTNTKILFQK